MDKLDMVAIKPLKYQTRRLKPDDEFTAASRRDFRLLAAIKKARPADAPSEADDEMTALRARYKEVVGKQAYHGWDAETLSDKITEAE